MFLVKLGLFDLKFIIYLGQTLMRNNRKCVSDQRFLKFKDWVEDKSKQIPVLTQK
jgi:hypothetical protein